MNLADLSVSELARMTGLAIGPEWNCATAANGNTCVAVWSEPALRAEDLLEAAPSSLPCASAVRVEWRTGVAFWDAEWPISFDLHWLREITPGFPLGVRPVRVWPEYSAPSSVRLQGGFVYLFWRDASARTRVQVTRPRAENWAVTIGAGEDPVSPAPKAMDEVLRALTGSTSIEWLRGVFADSCSSRWSELAERIGARPDQFDDLATFFRTLTTTEEDALWRAAATAARLNELRPWLSLLSASEIHALQERLRDELEREGAAFWRGAAGEWLNAMAGGPLAGLPTPARHMLSLLIRNDLAGLLIRLRAVAEEEWTSLAPWYRRRIEESCGTLSDTTSSENVLEEISPWMKRLHARLRLQSAEAVRLNARTALSAPKAAQTARCDGNRVFAEFAFDATPRGDAAIDRLRNGDWRPCFDRVAGAKLLGGQICYVLNRRIGLEVLLPFLSRKAWAMDRESLAEAEVRQSGNAQLTLLRTYAAGTQAGPRHSAAMLLSAVYVSRAEMPADNMIHMVHEDRRTLYGNECDAAWLRLVRAYGLPAPQLPETPCEATLRIEIPWNWAEAWCYAPVKRDAVYLEKFMQLSLEMQEMTRHWLPALYLASPDRFDSPNAVLPLLVYAASRPYVERRRAEFGYGAMSPNLLKRAVASASARLPEILAPLHQSLRASGRLSTAQLYSPDRAKLIVSALQRQPRALARLLAFDTFFLEYCFQIAGMCRELRAVAGRNPARALRRLSQFSEDIVKTCQRGMKMIHVDQAYRGLGTIYLLEATRVLAEGSIENSSRASLTVEAGAVMRRYEAAA